LKNNQTSAFHATQEINLWVGPHPKKNSPLPILKKKPPLEGGGITMSSLPHQKKTLLEKKKILNPLSPFLKTPFTTCISFNLIELSTVYTH
jgi:hypothetical protein